MRIFGRQRGAHFRCQVSGKVARLPSSEVVVTATILDSCSLQILTSRIDLAKVFVFLVIYQNHNRCDGFELLKWGAQGNFIGRPVRSSLHDAMARIVTATSDVGLLSQTRTDRTTDHSHNCTSESQRKQQRSSRSSLVFRTLALTLAN
nr:hypothetical protein CFP56_21548 [Quercus suber]